MNQIRNVSIIDWEPETRRFMEEPFLELGYSCHTYDPRDALSPETDLFFSFGYFDDFFLFLRKLENLNSQTRPMFVHWNTEGLPDLRFPHWISLPAGIVRSTIARRANGPRAGFLFRRLNRRLHRFRYLGDYHYALSHGLMQSLFDSSTIYVAEENRMGLPARYVPWGTLRSDYASLQLERDIDVLWMAKRRGKRRNGLVRSIRDQLAKHGKKMVLIDGVENPYVFGSMRTELLNRSKVTLNLLPAWDAYNYIFKFHLAAANRSLLISEPFLKHNPEYIEGYHYISAKPHQLVDTLIHYCEQEQIRSDIVENAYQLVTSSMTMTNSIRAMISQLTDGEPAAPVCTPEDSHHVKS